MQPIYDEGESYAANDPAPTAHWSQVVDIARKVIAIRLLVGAERRAAVIALLREMHGEDVVIR